MAEHVGSLNLLRFNGFSRELPLQSTEEHDRQYAEMRERLAEIATQQAVQRGEQ